MSDEIGLRGGARNICDSLSVANEAANPDTPQIYEFGPFRLEPSERKLLRGNEIVALTPKAFDTLLLWSEIAATFWRRTSSSGSFGPTVSWKRAACPTTSSCCERPWGKIPRSLKRFLGEVTASSGPFDNCRTLSHRP